MKIIADTDMMAQVASQAQYQATHFSDTLQQLSSTVGQLHSWEGASYYEFTDAWASISHSLQTNASQIDRLGKCLQTAADSFYHTDQQSAALWGGAGGGGGDGFMRIQLGGSSDNSTDNGVSADQWRDIWGFLGNVVTVGELDTLLALWAKQGVKDMADGPFKDWLSNISSNAAFVPGFSIAFGAGLDFMSRDHSQYGMVHDANAALIGSALETGAMYIPGVGEVIIANDIVQISGSLAVWGTEYYANNYIADPQLKAEVIASAKELKQVLGVVNVNNIFTGIGDAAASGLDAVGSWLWQPLTHPSGG